MGLGLRFWSKVKSRPGGCWLWIAAKTNDGYGLFTLKVGDNYRTVRAHRAVYEDMVGKIPSMMDIDHLCSERACVNPRHLEPVSKAEHVQRTASRGTRKRKKDSKYCKHGHLRSKYSIVRANGFHRCKECDRMGSWHRRKRKA